VRQALWETVIELVDATQARAGAAGQVRILSITLDLPIRISVADTDRGWEVRGDLPNWRWRTSFDDPPSRLRLEYSTTHARDGDGQ
jgi:hypothetical protein